MFPGAIRGANKQPTGAAQINWANPITRGLQACVYPVGNSFYEAVSGEAAGASPTVYRGKGMLGGTANRRDCIYGIPSGTSSANEIVKFSISGIRRGAKIVNTGTMLCLGGLLSNNVAEDYYCFANTENYNAGYGTSLLIDNYKHIGIGGVGRGTGSTIIGASSTSLDIGSPAGPDKTVYFGYSFNANGANGTFFLAGQGETWTSGSVFGDGTTYFDYRRLVIFSANDYSMTVNQPYIGLGQLWDRELTLNEYQMLHENPWQVLVGR